MKSTRTKGFRVLLTRVVTACACCLLLISIFFPFVTLEHGSMIMDHYDVTYWSYRATVRKWGVAYVESEPLLLSNYWFENQEPYSYPATSYLGITWILVALFHMQILTLGFGFFAVFKQRKSTQLLPVISCFSVVFLMGSMVAQAGSLSGLARRAGPKYELGYWLCYPSIILFILAFILQFRTRQNT